MDTNQVIKKPFYKRWWFITLIILWTIGYFFGEKSDTSASDSKQIENSKVEFITNGNQGWYRGVIPAYTMSIGNIEMQKSLIYVRLNNKYATVIHSQIGQTFIGGGSYSYSQNSTQSSGAVETTAEDDKGNSSGYQFSYSLKDDGKLFLTLKGNAGQPDVKMERYYGEVTADVVLADFAQTILKQ